MSEIQQSAARLNPWVFHLKKLGLELKCPVCLNLLNKPILLSCDHIFCNSCVPKASQFSAQCPACQQHFTDQEMRPASYMENIVAIYRSLNATFNSTVLPLLTTDELDVDHAAEVSPGSTTSGTAKDAEGHISHPGSGNMSAENHSVKKSVGDYIVKATSGVDDKATFYTREYKRQKKLNYGSSEAVLQTYGYSQQIASYSNQAAVSECNDKYKFTVDTHVTSSKAASNAPHENGSPCAFCHSSKMTEGTGPLLHYADGKEVARGEIGIPNAIPVHSKCLDWTPRVYFEKDIIRNLESELMRASKLKCNRCGLKGAALGCFAKSCRRSYHVPCAMEIPDCRWDCGDYVMLCPTHKLIKFPSEKANSRKRHSRGKCSFSTHSASKQSHFWAAFPNGPPKWGFCGSALSPEEKCLVVEFAAICGATVFKFWNPNVTHVIAATDSNRACSRTLKVLMAILRGRWILTMDWIRACVEVNCPVNEEPYEVDLDRHGFRGGPKTGRLRVSNNAPKLFDGLSFYFNGDFVLSYKSDLLDLVRAGGGTIIESTEKRDAPRDNPELLSTTFVVYNRDFPQECVAAEANSFLLKRLAEAEDVAKDMDALVIPHAWILQSIAACKRLLPYPLCK